MAIEEGKYLSDLLKWELDKNYCREVVTVASGQNLKRGAIVGLIAASGLAKEAYLITDAEGETLDGSEMAVGILLDDVDATSGAKEAVIVSRVAIVCADGIIFTTGATDTQKKKIIKDLDVRGIVIRKAV